MQNHTYKLHIIFGCFTDQSTAGSFRVSFFSADAGIIITIACVIDHCKIVGKHTVTSGNICCRDGIGSSSCNCAESVIFHGGFHDQCHVTCSCVLILIRKSGRVGKDSICAAKLLCTGIHCLHEGIYRTADMFCHLQCDIIGRSNHDRIQALCHGKYFI